MSGKIPGMTNEPSRFDAEGWMPIDTAPKDRRRVIVYLPPCRYADGQLYAGLIAEAYEVSPGKYHSKNLNLIFEPTHWRNFMAPPNDIVMESTALGPASYGDVFVRPEDRGK